MQFAESTHYVPTPAEIARAAAKVDREYKAIFAAERERQAADPRYIEQVRNLARLRVTAHDRILTAVMKHRKAAVQLCGDALEPGDIRTLEELLDDLANA